MPLLQFFLQKEKRKIRCILDHFTLAKSLCSSFKTMLELCCPHKLHAEQSSINLMVILSFIPQPISVGSFGSDDCYDNCINLNFNV